MRMMLSFVSPPSKMTSLLTTFTIPFFLLLLVGKGSSTTDPGDIAVLRDFYNGLSNPSLLQWPAFTSSADPCGDNWNHVFCSGSRVSQIQVANFGLEGTLPTSFNSLTELFNLGLQRNKFKGPLPTFRGLANLQFAFLGGNQFDSIPGDFFDGLTALQVLSLEQNPLNQSTGWSLPTSLQSSSQLRNLSLSSCNLIGSIPDFLGLLPTLSVLQLSYNSLSGAIPVSFHGSQLRIFTLNNQNGDGLSGPIDVIATMTSLLQPWLHGNQFSGVIPAGVASCVSLVDVRLSRNKLVGPIPPAMASLPSLEVLWLDNNMLTGPIPKFNIANFTYMPNSFCQNVPGEPCSEEVAALLDFIGNVSFPVTLAGQWSGNDPCGGSWLGVSCNADGTISTLNLPSRNLNGTISPSLAKLSSLIYILLGSNNLEGLIPPELTGLKYLRLLNLSSNNLGPPVPTFSNAVTVLLDGNPLLAPNSGAGGSPSSSGGNSPSSDSSSPASGRAPPKNVVSIVASVATFAAILLFLIPGAVFLIRKRRRGAASRAFAVHPRDPSDPDNIVKISVVANNSDATGSSISLHTRNGNVDGVHLIETGNLLISVQVLRCVTRDFAPENEIGRGGFGVVYKGAFDDGTIIAVKRMEAAVINNKALEEFQSEIAVLSRVRHRHLVSLLGYCVEGNERMLVYEYMPQGALSKHLFQWEKLNLQPLSWKRRLNIALDVARGLEYLHNMAHQSFIHRDLKPSNILLGDDFRAKISDFGLVKLAPDGKTSVATRLAGTFGYLAPEYAVTGKVTTKADVFSFGVVLMELLTGLTALDDNRPEESRYLMSYFWKIKLNAESLAANLDPGLDVKEDVLESIQIVAELARHCTSREPNQRPDMGYAVNVLSPLVEKWKPTDEDEDEFEGISYDRPLLQMVKAWQDNGEVGDHSFSASDDSNPSFPSRPNGFADSFASTDCR